MPAVPSVANGSCSTVTGTPMPQQVRKTPNSHEPRTNLRKDTRTWLLPSCRAPVSRHPRNWERRCGCCGPREGRCLPHAPSARVHSTDMPCTFLCPWPGGCCEGPILSVSETQPKAVVITSCGKPASAALAGPHPQERSSPGPRGAPLPRATHRDTRWQKDCVGNASLPEKLPRRLGTKLFSSIVNWPQDNFLSTY